MKNRLRTVVSFDCDFDEHRPSEQIALCPGPRESEHNSVSIEKASARVHTIELHFQSRVGDGTINLMEKLKKFLKSDVGVRPVLYMAVVLLWLLCLGVWQLTDNEIWSGLFIEACSVVVSVLLIDSLIRVDRRSRLKKANEINTKSVDFSLTWSLSRIRSTIGINTTIEDISD